MVEEGVQHKHCREPVPPRGGTLPLGSAMGQKCRMTRDCYLRSRVSPPRPRRHDIMLRSAPMTVLSSPLSMPPWPRCAVAPVPGTAFALRPEPRARLLRSLRRPALLSASQEILASVGATRYARAYPQYWPIKYGGYATTAFGLPANERGVNRCPRSGSSAAGTNRRSAMSAFSPLMGVK